MNRIFAFLILSLFLSGIIQFSAVTLASSVYSVTSISDFNSGVFSSTTVSDIGGGDGNVANTYGPEALDQSQTTGNTQRGFDNTSWLAQTFTVGQSGFLTKVNIRLDRNNSNNTDGVVVLELRNTVGNAPGSTILASTSTPASFIDKNDATDYDFVFASQPEVTAGAVYALAVYRSGSGALTANYNWFSDNNGSDSYAGGGRYTSASGANWTLQNSGKGDLRFKTYYLAYAASGILASDILDTNASTTKFNQLSWSETLPAGTDITFEVRASTSVFLKTDVLPAWISLNSTNSPADLGSALPSSYQYFQWRTTLSSSGTNTPILQDVSLAYNRPPVLDAIGNKTVNENQNLSFIISATDPDNDSLTYFASNLPAGASFDQNTKTFSWTPDFSQAGSHSITFKASDGSLETSEIIAVSVENVIQDDGGIFISRGGGGSAGAPFGSFTLEVVAPAAVVPGGIVPPALPVLVEQAPAQQNFTSAAPVIPAISETPASQAALDQTEIAETIEAATDNTNLTGQLVNQTGNQSLEDLLPQSADAEPKSPLAAFLEFIKLKELIGLIGNFALRTFSSLTR